MDEQHSDLIAPQAAIALDDRWSLNQRVTRAILGDMAYEIGADIADLATQIAAARSGQTPA